MTSVVQIWKEKETTETLVAACFGRAGENGRRFHELCEEEISELPAKIIAKILLNE